jgi:hypothetical protein
MTEQEKIGKIEEIFRSYHNNFPENDIPLDGLTDEQQENIEDGFSKTIGKIAEYIADEIFETKEERENFIKNSTKYIR